MSPLSICAVGSPRQIVMPNEPYPPKPRFGASLGC
jgi:hypothetical protein